MRQNLSIERSTIHVSAPRKPRRLCEGKPINKYVEHPKRLYSYINRVNKGGETVRLYRDFSTTSPVEADCDKV